MLQAADTDLFNPLIPKAHSSGYQNLQFPFANYAIKSRLKL